MTHHLSIFSHARLSAAALFAASVLALSPVAFAHGGAKAAHGGIAQVAHDINFELVAQADGATLYLVDHGKPMSSQGISGKLTILNKGQKSEADLKPCRRRSKSEPPCRSNIEPGLVADQRVVSCG